MPLGFGFGLPHGISFGGGNGAPPPGPSLNLNFTSGSLDPRITFARGTTGTYVNSSGIVATAAINAPRFTFDPTSLTASGLLNEGQRTNLLLYSENLSGAAWLKTGTPVLDAAIVDPTGTTGTVYYPTVSEIVQNFNGGGATTVALSFFAKKRTASANNLAVFQFFQQTVSPVVFLATYSFDLVGANPDATYIKNVTRTAYPNGWYRFTCQLVANTGSGAGNFTSTARVDLEGANSTNYIWGVQIEAATFSTSYIPTVASQVTRGADSAIMTGSNFSGWYNQSVGTVYHESSALAVGQPYFLFDDATTVNQIYSYCGTGESGQRTLVVKRNDVFEVVMDGSTAPANTFVKSASRLQTSNFANVINAGAATTVASGAMPTVNRLVLGGNGAIRRFTYYPRALSDAELGVVTS